MTQNPPAKTSSVSPAWRRCRMLAALLCALVLVQPSPAAESAPEDATFNFVGADIESVIKAVGQFTNTTFLIDPRIKGTLTLVSEKPVDKAQALKLLTSLLRMQGYAMVAADGYTKVVPEVDAKVQLGATQAGRAKGDQIATRIFRLNHGSAGGLISVLRPLISVNNTIAADPSNNSLVITDYADNLARLEKIIAALDGPGFSSLDVVPIRHASASDIAVMANRLLEPGSAADAGHIRLLADPRTNSVIVRASSTARADLAKSLIAKLDQPTAQPGNSHVVHLKNAEATRLAQTLRAVVASETSAQSLPGTSTAAAQPASTRATSTGGLQAPPPSPASAQGPLPSGGAAGFIQADPVTNTLIITASEPVYRVIRGIIDELDARRAQVLVESLIVEVSADKAAEFGVQWIGLSGDGNSRYRIGGGTSFSTGGNNLVNQAIARQSTGLPAVPSNGLTLGILRQIGGQLGLGALAHALETDANANILSVPNVITLDNEEAKIMVGQNVPFVTGQFTTPASAGAAGVNPFQTIERRDIGLSLRVRPQISEGGTVKMAIYQESSSVRDASNAAGIITNKRSIDTNVLVNDGDIIVLGGLIEENVQDGNEKVPFFGDIPVIGNLFKFQTRKRVKTNLMVFLRPTVMRNNEQSNSVTSDLYDFVRGVQSNAQPAPTPLLPDTGAPVLPPLEQGRPVGGPLVQPVPPIDNEMKKPSQQSPAAPN